MPVRRRQPEAFPIDMTPLIDLVFQVLLFFILTSTFVVSPGIRVDLPPAATAQRLGAANIVITLTKDHLIFWEDTLVTMQELRAKLQALGRAKPVLIRADRYAYVDKLIALWDLCRDSGYQQVQIATLTE
jgi:biopolymer transport protein ExbD